MARLFCELSSRLATVGLAADGRFAFPLTQGQLGEALGISNVHVNRSIQALRGDDLLVWRSGQVRISDWERLVMRGEFDAGYLHQKSEPR